MGSRRECQALNVGMKEPPGKTGSSPWKEKQLLRLVIRVEGRTTEPHDKLRQEHNTGWNSICQGHPITGWDVGGAMSPDLKTDLQISLSWTTFLNTEHNLT